MYREEGRSGCTEKKREWVYRGCQCGDTKDDPRRKHGAFFGFAALWDERDTMSGEENLRRGACEEGLAM